MPGRLAVSARITDSAYATLAGLARVARRIDRSAPIRYLIEREIRGVLEIVIERLIAMLFPLQYHGGPVLSAFAIYPLYYGNWDAAHREIVLRREGPPI
jgi:hypothetical protein